MHAGLDLERIEFFEQLGMRAMLLEGIQLLLRLLLFPPPHPPFETALIGEIGCHEQLDWHAVHVELAETVGETAVMRTSACIQAAIACGRGQLAPVSTTRWTVSWGDVKVVAPEEGKAAFLTMRLDGVVTGPFGCSSFAQSDGFCCSRRLSNGRRFGSALLEAGISTVRILGRGKMGLCGLCAVSLPALNGEEFCTTF